MSKNACSFPRTKPQHSPTPWKIYECRRGFLGQRTEDMKPFIAIGTALPGNGPDATLAEMKAGDSTTKFSGRGNRPVNHSITEETALANAAHIVRCVNAHDAMVEALERIVTGAESLRGRALAVGALVAIAADARAALALARP